MQYITEKDFQATVIDLARTYGWIVGFTYDARKSEPGEPDLRMVHPTQHRVIFAELKTTKGKLTKADTTSPATAGSQDKTNGKTP